MEWWSGFFQSQLEEEYLLKQKKLIMIVLSIIFVFSIVFYFLSSKGENQTEKDNEFITEEDNSDLPEENTEWEESSFKYDSVDFRYHAETGTIAMDSLLDKNEQRHVLEYKLYNFLFNKGYKEIQSIDIYGGTEIETEFIEFSAVAITKKEKEELELKIVYNTGLYSFGIHFIKDEYNATPVSIQNIDYEVEKVLRDKLKILEREFGIFAFNEKLEANTASITHYEIEDNILSMQVELDDEYQTYCRIYYDMEQEKFDFRKW